ncbi:MAG: type II secretion system GspH family protein [Proteobacteria bacterium]|nr:type II secretion system GspH family protein [Pseudomonadota bacterium]
MISKKPEGYSLVELTIVILIAGIILSLLYKYYPRAKQVQQRTVQPSNTEYIDNALVGFSYSHGRLPFPDSDNDGLENVGSLRGTIPERTLGMAEKPVNDFNIPLVYSIFRRVNNVDDTIDADLAVNKDRLYALLPSGIRTAALTALGQSNTIDFCFALRTAANITVNDATALYVSETTPVIYNRNVAYVLVDVGQFDADGNGQLLDGFNTGGLRFEVAGKAKSPEYDDQVSSTEFSELFGLLACGSAISAALHAHDNAVLAADMMYTSFIDYSNLLDLTGQLAEADVALAVAVVLQAIAGTANAVAGAATATAETLTPPFTALGAPALIEIGIASGLAVLATAAAAVTTGFAIDALVKINDAIACFDEGNFCAVGTGNFVSNASTLTATIRANAVAADQAGL